MGAQSSAPELTPSPPFRATPLLVAGTEGYDGGEYLYQDHVHDDFGAEADQSSPVASHEDYLLAPPSGTYRYPTDVERYGAAAADLLEFRVRVEPDRVRYNITLAALLVGDSTAVTVAIAPDGVPGPRNPWPFEAGVTEGLGIRWFLVHWGTSAVWVDALTRRETVLPDASVDLDANRLAVSVPRVLADPRRDTWRMFAGVGLWDASGRRYLMPRPGPPGPGVPGGGAAGLPAFFNVAFRFTEPLRSSTSVLRASEAGPASAPTGGSGTWAETRQAASLSGSSVSPFHADVDFDKLERHVLDRPDVRPGRTVNRIYASRFARPDGEGVRLNPGLAPRPDDPSWGPMGSFLGRVQSYALHVPSSVPFGDRPGVLLSLHPAGANMNWFSGTQWTKQLGDALGLLVAVPHGRGGSNAWTGLGEADALEVLDDVRANYDVDPDRVFVAGYAMGGYGAYRIALSHPDLFAAAFVIDAPMSRPRSADLAPVLEEADDVRPFVPAARPVPFLIWHASDDALVPVTHALASAEAFDEPALRYELDVFAGHAHFSLATPPLGDEWAPAMSFLRFRRREATPSRFTVVTRPRWNFHELGLGHDHAYWVSRVRVRTLDAPGASGRVDVESEAVAGVQGVPLPTQTSWAAGPPSPYLRRWRSWGLVGAVVDNRVNVDLHNASSARIHLPEAGLDAARTVVVVGITDGPATLELTGLHRDVRLEATGGLTLTVADDGAHRVHVPGRTVFSARLVPPLSCT